MISASCDLQVIGPNHVPPSSPHAFRFTGISFDQEIRDYNYLNHYSGHVSEFAIVSLRLHCTRDPTYYIFRIVGVLLMVAVLKLCTSLVPLADYNTKVGLGATR